jgi:hypothetical protein
VVSSDEEFFGLGMNTSGLALFRLSASKFQRPPAGSSPFINRPIR